MKDSVRLVFCIFILVLFALPALAAHLNVDASIGAGYLAGKNQYEIGGAVHSSDGQHIYLDFPISRLEFPIDMGFFSLDGNLDIIPQWSFSASLKRNFTDPGSDMKDSDWIFGGFGGNDTKDIYSTSKMECEAWIFDINTRYRFIEALHGQGTLTGPQPRYKYQLFAGLGYMHQSFAYDVYDLDQFYPQLPSIPHDVFPGAVLVYDLTFDIPYLMIGAEASYGHAWTISLEGRASWFTHTTDEDQHLLRDKVTKVDSDWDGSTYGGLLKIRYNITPQWFCALEGSLMAISVDTRSSAALPGVAPYTIDQKIESDQSGFFLSGGYEF
ncbi:MAG: omptin family outer membrane protease [Desulfatibacillum sp.]|nr:omptin family outer membrane protease [Desulfatibacillum sp.]